MPRIRPSRRRSRRRGKGKSTKILNEGLTQSVHVKDVNKIGESDEELKRKFMDNFKNKFKREYEASQFLLRNREFKEDLKKLVGKLQELVEKYLKKFPWGSQGGGGSEFAWKVVLIMMFVIVFWAAGWVGVVFVMACKGLL